MVKRGSGWGGSWTSDRLSVLPSTQCFQDLWADLLIRSTSANLVFLCADTWLSLLLAFPQRSQLSKDCQEALLCITGR